ncbi:MAG: hypothetical protein ACYSTY_14430, partial [Planctomycetota bacterium]
ARGVLGRLPDAEHAGGFDPVEPVMAGSVGAFPYEDGTTDLQIRYIKLSLDEERLAEFPRTVRDYRAETAHRRFVFPQEPTTDQNFTTLQFEAYRDLGYCIVKAFHRRFDFADPNSGIAAREPWSDCMSPPGGRSGDRPSGERR